MGARWSLLGRLSTSELCVCLTRRSPAPPLPQFPCAELMGLEVALLKASPELGFLDSRLQLWLRAAGLPPHRHHHRDVGSVGGPHQGPRVLQRRLGVPQGANQVACQRRLPAAVGGRGTATQRLQTGTPFGGQLPALPAQ